MMDGTAVIEIKKLAERAVAQTVKIDGKEYSTVQLHDPREALPAPATLIVHTLGGLVGYIGANRDTLDLSKCLIHIEGPEAVSLRSELRGEFQQRFRYVAAEVVDRFAGMPGGFRFGTYLAAESMIIALQALFEADAQRAALLKLLGNLRDDNVKTQADDGITQTATVRQGVAVVEEVKVPNPVTLAPFRTFAEVEQPASPFVFRLRKGNAGAEAALFEADGGAWRLAAIDAIRDWLAEVVPDELAIIS